MLHSRSTLYKHLIYFVVRVGTFAFCLPFHILPRYPAGMLAPERNHNQVVRCKGCRPCIPISVEAVIGSVTVACPVCMERRSYIVYGSLSRPAVLGSDARAPGETVMDEKTADKSAVSWLL